MSDNPERSEIPMDRERIEGNIRKAKGKIARAAVLLGCSRSTIYTWIYQLGLEKMAQVGWETRRANMVEVCTVCHTSNYVSNFYEQYDALIELYNSKFAQPGVDFMKLLYENRLISDTKFDDLVEWTWWEIWHHEGRVARHGASMMAPDYTHWHGTYEIAKHWYAKFIPELDAIVEKNLRSSDAAKVAAAKALDAKIDQVMNSRDHRWSQDKMDPKEAAARKKAAAEFRKRYEK